MRILDIDLDLFQSGIASDTNDADEFQAWTAQEARDLLERLGLLPSMGTAAKYCVHHDEVFWLWRELIQLNRLPTPFTVVHVDAHADLGLGGLGDGASFPRALAAQPAHQRDSYLQAHRDMVCPGNYLLSAVAMRWVQSVTYVYHPSLSAWDIPYGVTVDDEPQGASLPRPMDPYDFTLQLEASEPRVPLRYRCAADYKDAGPWDLAYVTQSPNYLAAGTENLLAVIREYLPHTD